VKETIAVINNVNAPAQIRQDAALSPAQTLWDLTGEDMASVDALILDRMQSSVGLIPDLAEHLVGAGGKRLRPLLTISAAQLCEYAGNAHHKLAAAVEFIHSATLLHDDVVDESALRRGKKPANLIWGNSASILVGDFLFARAFNLMVETDSMEALGILSNASSVIAEGEVQQLAALRNLAMTEADYMRVIEAKTAALFAAATEVAPVIAKRPAAERAALKEYGLKLGLAFQLVDDALDYGGMASALGKSVIVDHDQKDVDLERAVSLLRTSGALESTMELAKQYSQDAADALDVFPVSPLRDTLKDLAGFVVARIS